MRILGLMPDFYGTSILKGKELIGIMKGYADVYSVSDKIILSLGRPIWYCMKTYKRRHNLY